MIELIHQLLLMMPTAVEVYDDRHGDDHANKHDLVVRASLTVFASCVSAYLHAVIQLDPMLFYQWLPKCLVLSSAYFIAFFNYAVNIAQRKVTEDQKWWNHLNDKSWPDNWRLWRWIGWEWRMMVCLGIFVGAVLYYAS